MQKRTKIEQRIDLKKKFEQFDEGIEILKLCNLRNGGVKEPKLPPFVVTQ